MNWDRAINRKARTTLDTLEAVYEDRFQAEAYLEGLRLAFLYHQGRDAKFRFVVRHEPGPFGDRWVVERTR